MAAIETFQGFFSYNRLDAENYPILIKALTDRLPKLVTGKLANARFVVWQDVKNIRTGELWDGRIADAVRTSHVFVAFMTPKWFESANCRREYEIFKQVEGGKSIGEYVVPLLAHEVEAQLRNFDRSQRNTYDDLNKRQYKKIVARSSRTTRQRQALIEEIAEDIHGMIERFRHRPPKSGGAAGAVIVRRANRVAEFVGNPHNFEKDGFVTAAEVLVESQRGNKPRDVFVHLAFIERLYVETPDGKVKVEFGIRRAYLSIDDGTARKLRRNPDWAQYTSADSVYYVIPKADPETIAICINPESGRRSITDLPLPPADNENFLAKPALAAPDAEIPSIRAELTVSLCPEGLTIAGEDPRKPSAAFSEKIAAIVSVLAAKNESADGSGLIRLRLPVRERT